MIVDGVLRFVYAPFDFGGSLHWRTHFDSALLLPGSGCCAVFVLGFVLLMGKWGYREDFWG